MVSTGNFLEEGADLVSGIIHDGWTWETSGYGLIYCFWLMITEKMLSLPHLTFILQSFLSSERENEEVGTEWRFVSNRICLTILDFDKIENAQMNS